MKTWISIVLLFLFSIQTFSSLVMDAAYYCNQNYVATKLCINQSQPQLHCNGKCYLSKQIQKENKSQSQNANNKKQNANLIYLFPSKHTFAQQAISSQSLIGIGFYVFSPQEYLRSFLKPPCSFFV